MKTVRAGFGLLEVLAGLVAFVVLSAVGTKAYRSVIANHKEAAQVKALTDAVAMTAERLSGLTLAALAGAGSPRLAWSAPAMIGAGPSHYRYRIVPRPMVGGAQDTTVVGLEVESGPMRGGSLVPERTFATLIPPNLASRNDAGAQANTLAERAAEDAFHRDLMARISDLTERVVSENQLRLNSFSCYDQDQCCDFMRRYFADPSIAPEDGLEEKCHYRCALGGEVTGSQWRESCGFDMCSIAPWKTKTDCCAAIAENRCPPGSACAQVCVECVGEDGSTCNSTAGVCDGWWWNDFFDCKNETFCDGTALPDGTVEGWGNVKSLCRTSACQGLNADCWAKTWSCCVNYWGPLARGETPDPRAAICERISSKQECCAWEAKVGDWTLYCGADGKVVSGRNDRNSQWYCGMSGGGWDHECSHAIGCAEIHRPAGAPNAGCQAWNGPYLESPWVNSMTGERPPAVVVTPMETPTTPVITPPTTGGGTPVLPRGDEKGPGRSGSNREGGKWSSQGGRE